MAQTPLSNTLAHVPSPPTTTIIATNTPFSLPSPHATASFLLPPKAFAWRQHPHSHRRANHQQAIPFALAQLPAAQLAQLLPDIPASGTIAVLVETEALVGYVDEEQPPRVLLSVQENGSVVFPLDDTWPWLGVEWYPGVGDFGGHAEGVAWEGEGEGRQGELR